MTDCVRRSRSAFDDFQRTLAKTTQNPVGDIVSVPFQFNFNGGGALRDGTFFSLNVQPVIPIHLTRKWTLISRAIVPLDSFPGPDGVKYSGFGDIQEQTFFSPREAVKVIWGIGPAFSLPTATALPALTGTWGAGGSAAGVRKPMCGRFRRQRAQSSAGRPGASSWR